MPNLVAKSSAKDDEKRQYLTSSVVDLRSTIIAKAQPQETLDNTST
jgi:hypothetical protein